MFSDKWATYNWWVTVQLDFDYYFCVLTSRSFYRPQRSCGKLMFSQASVILFTGGVSAGHPPVRHPPGRHSTGQTPTKQTATLGRHTPWADIPPGRHPLGRNPLGRHPPPADGYCSGWYASYWNAFLFILDPHPIVFLGKRLGK